MKVTRLIIAALVGVVVTFVLFLFMQELISSGRNQRGELEVFSGIRFGPVEIPDDVVTRSRRKPKKPPPPKNPPPPPKMKVNAMSQQVQEMPQMDVPNLDLPMVGGEGMFIGNYQQVDRKAEGDVIPIVVIRPMYPREAAISGIEGWVRVEFTITETGTVKKPRVIEAKPPRIFNREAIRAILKWKFKPRVVDGIAVERRASYTIEFKLDNA